MATNTSNIPPLKHTHRNAADEEDDDDEDYIDMEVMNSSSSSSSPQMREFEFQMSSISIEKQSSTSPADELFYRGNLLPLHLPPRLQMVQKLLQTTTIERQDSKSSTSPSTNTTTPLESCNISPSESCRVSCELSPDDCHFEWSTDFSTLINTHPKKSWSKKLKLVNKSLISQKIKAYIKGLFIKSGEPCRSNNQYLNGNMNVAMKSSLPHPTIASVLKNESEENVNNQRRSFSSAIKRHSPTKCLSSSSSSSSSANSSSSYSSSSIAFVSNGSYELKRSSSDTSEIEGSIEAAIAHCKKSQDLSTSRKPLLGASCSI